MEFKATIMKEDDVRRALKRMAHQIIEKNEGCKVVSSCGNFASAISDFIKLRPDVVFMDRTAR